VIMNPTAKAVKLLVSIGEDICVRGRCHRRFVVLVKFWSTCRPVRILQIICAKIETQGAFFDKTSWSE
jgi:hypothetical protein